MRELIIQENEADQRADKFLKKYFNQAPPGFIYKMLRKKNITLNDKKMTGSEKLCVGDVMKLFLAEETLEKFCTQPAMPVSSKKLIDFPVDEIKKRILYEDKDVIFYNKPAGLLSQKAGAADESANELLIGYMLATGQLTREELRTFKPSVCNRLDRNTTGILIFGKTLSALQEFSALLKSRELEKYYLCIVQGVLPKGERIRGYLKKDQRNNRVEVILTDHFERNQEKQEGHHGEDQRIISKNQKAQKEVQIRKADTQNSEGEYHCIETEYFPIGGNERCTLLMVHLITGKTHQIRAHLSGIGHPIAGDTKYGDASFNAYFRKKYGLQSQLLHAYELRFERPKRKNCRLKQDCFVAEPPEIMSQILKGEKIKWEPGTVVASGDRL